jgi:hypothetical protein
MGVRGDVCCLDRSQADGRRRAVDVEQRRIVAGMCCAVGVRMQTSVR